MRPLFLFLCCGALNSCGEAQPDDWLEGRWAVDGQTCDAAWLTYRSDGTWSDERREGRWERDGLNLRTSFTGWSETWPHRHVNAVQHTLCHTERLQRLGDDELRSTWEDDTTHRLRRCHPVEITYPHRGCLADCDRVTPYDPSPWNEGPPAATRSC